MKRPRKRALRAGDLPTFVLHDATHASAILADGTTFDMRVVERRLRIRVRHGSISIEPNSANEIELGDVL